MTDNETSVCKHGSIVCEACAYKRGRKAALLEAAEKYRCIENEEQSHNDASDWLRARAEQEGE